MTRHTPTAMVGFMPDDPSLEDQVRKRIADTGISHSELARQADIPQPSIARFVNRGRATITSATLDRLIKALGGARLTWKRRRRK